MLQLFVNKKGLINNYLANPIICKCCGELIESRGYYFEEWSRIRTPRFQQRFVCNDCSRKGKHLLSRPLKTIYEYTLVLTVIFTNNIPSSVMPYVPVSPEFKASKNIDSYSLADEELLINYQDYKHLISAKTNQSKEIGFVDGRKLLEQKDEEMQGNIFAKKLLGVDIDDES